MGRTRIYIAPFDTTGAYQAYVDVTKYVLDKRPRLKRQVDSNEFDVGVLKYGNITLNFNNEDGTFSDVDDIQSMFAYSRANSKVKLTWEQSIIDQECGVAITDAVCISEEITLFEGLLNDDGSKTDIREQHINFVVLGFESIFSQVETPFSSLANGDLVSAILLDCLNQTAITDLMTVSASNISLSIDPVVDVVEDLENTTVKEALDELLDMANSILYIKDNVLYVTARTVGATLQHTFYGQSARIGTEDVIKISEIRKGLNKTFNFWTWEDTSLLRNDSTSVTNYGVRKKEIGFTGITTDATRYNILANLLAEFKDPMLEFKLTAPLNYETMALQVLNKVTVDYPTLFFPADDGTIPIFDISAFDSAIFPYAEWSLTLTTTDNYKILGIDTNTAKETITFTLRKV